MQDQEEEKYTVQHAIDLAKTRVGNKPLNTRAVKRYDSSIPLTMSEYGQLAEQICDDTLLLDGDKRRK